MSNWSPKDLVTIPGCDRHRSSCSRRCCRAARRAGSGPCSRCCARAWRDSGARPWRARGARRPRPERAVRRGHGRHQGASADLPQRARRRHQGTVFLTV